MTMTNEEIIEDLLLEIKTEWSDADRKEFFLTPWKYDNGLRSFHHTLGRHIRNKYKLWERKDAAVFNWNPNLRTGIEAAYDHPDNVSMKIMEEVWKRGSYGETEETR